MSLEDTLFVGFNTPNLPCLPLEDILEHHGAIRDAIAGTKHIEPTDLESLVAHFSFIYAFNTYKAIGLLLPELYYESGAVVLRPSLEKLPVALGMSKVSLYGTSRGTVVADRWSTGSGQRC